MRNYARIDGGVVVELLNTNGDITKMFHPDLVWVDVSAVSPAPAPGWSAIRSGAQWVFQAPAAESPAALLLAAQSEQIATMYAGYNQSVQQPVSFTTSAGQNKVFQADSGSQTVLVQAITGYNLAGAVPSGFYWVAQDNERCPFTLADLKGLYAAMLAQGWNAFQHLQTQKSAIHAATTADQVNTIAW